MDLTNPTTLHFCSNCTHLLGNRSYQDNAASWRCNAVGNLGDSYYDLVSGRKISNFIKDTCYDARASEDSCGKEGRWYEEYVKPDFYAVDSEVANIPPKPKSLRAIGLDDL